MPRTYYRKLVRDRIPAIIAESGLRSRTRRLSPAAHARALKVKLCEEVRELLAARGRAAVVNELVDLQELLHACRRGVGLGPRAFESLVRKKRRERGGFRKRLFLEYTQDPR